MLVIFDCDGVLVDSEPLSNAALARSLGEIGLDLTAEEATAAFMGRSWASCLTRIEGLLGKPAPPGLRRDYEARRDAAFRERLRAVPGVVAAIEAVEAAGAHTCVASSGDHAKMRLTLGMTGLLERFAGRIFSAIEVEHGKPAPDLFLHAAARMGVAPGDCVVIEDSPVGVAGGCAAGMRVLGYAGRTPGEALAAADAVFADMSELPSLVADGAVTRGCAPR